MKIQKLNWAGIKLECGDKTILIDPVENFMPYLPILGQPMTPILHFSEEVKADYILLTHLHADHFDPAIIASCLKPEGKIVGCRKHEAELSKLDCGHVFLNEGERYEEDGIGITSVFSMDGIGEDQTAWIVDFNNTRIFHGGDTIWHNQFWKLGRKYKGIRYAFLPVNGVVVDFHKLGLAYSTVPASLNPEQAFNAAKLLQAETLIPIHYGKFATPYYQPCDSSPDVLRALSESIHQPFQVLEDGEYLN